jgi:hypothetical protein
VEQSDLLKLAIENLRRLNISYAIVGSFASSIWGESRLTQDIDIVVDLRSQQVASLCNAFPGPEFYVSEAAAHEAVAGSGQFNVIHPSSGNKIDFMVAGRTDWAVALLQRRVQLTLFPDQVAHVAAPEDVIIGKLVYYRAGGSEKHLRDIAGMLKFGGDLIDRAYVERFAKQLGVVDMWEAVRNSVDRS